MKLLNKHFILISLFVFSFNQSQADTLTIFPIIQKTALLSQAKLLTKGLWEPYAFAINNKIELSSFVFLNSVMPNFGAKINFSKSTSNKLQIASMHSLTYYSAWLKFWQGDGTGALITPQFKIPSMLMLKNGVMATYLFSPKLVLSGSLNFAFVLGNKIDKLYTVDIPMIYPRFSPAFIGPVFSLKTNLQGAIYKRIQYSIDLDYYKVSSKTYSNFYEGTFSLVYASSNKFKVCAGPIIVYGEYPFGKQWNIIPYINMYFAFDLKKKAKPL